MNIEKAIEIGRIKIDRNPKIYAAIGIVSTLCFFLIFKNIFIPPIGLIISIAVLVVTKYLSMINWCKWSINQSLKLDELKRKAIKDNLLWPFVAETYFPTTFTLSSQATEEDDIPYKELEKVNTNPTQNIDFDKQIQILRDLGYIYDEEVTKEMLLEIVLRKTGNINAEKQIIDNPFSLLYYTLGWRDPKIKNYNFTDKCIWFDLEFFDHNSQYKWFMQRMGAITQGAIEFSDITIETDSDKWEWIKFKVNGKSRKWKLEKAGYIADHFVQRFSHLPLELGTYGKYTYFNDGGQQWVIDFATEEEQLKFNQTTGLKREWLGEGNHFDEPPLE